MHQPLDHLKSRKKPVTRTTHIALDSEVADRVIAARQAYDQTELLLRARPNDEGLSLKLQDLEDDLNEAEADFKSNSAKFIAKSLGASAYERLVSQHPPTKEQRDEAKKMGIVGTLAFNAETFPKALIAECVYYVADVDEEGNEILEKLTPEWVKEAYEGDEWNEAELSSLFQIAYEANSSRRIVDMGNGSRRTRLS